jgi:hypothetical protein
MNERALVLRGAPDDRPQLEQINQVVAEMLGKNGFGYSYVHSESMDDDTTVHKWFGDHRGELLKLVDDVRLPARYFLIESSSEPRAAAVADYLRAALPVVPLSELRQEAAAHAADSPGALVRLALGAEGTFDAESAQVIKAALRHLATDVRRSAAMAAALLGWPEMSTALADANERERDPDVQRLLEYALAKSE